MNTSILHALRPTIASSSRRKLALRPWFSKSYYTHETDLIVIIKKKNSHYGRGWRRDATFSGSKNRVYHQSLSPTIKLTKTLTSSPSTHTQFHRTIRDRSWRPFLCNCRCSVEDELNWWTHDPDHCPRILLLGTMLKSLWVWWAMRRLLRVLKLIRRESKVWWRKRRDGPGKFGFGYGIELLTNSRSETPYFTPLHSVPLRCFPTGGSCFLAHSETLGFSVRFRMNEGCVRNWR